VFYLPGITMAKKKTRALQRKPASKPAANRSRVQVRIKRLEVEFVFDGAAPAAAVIDTPSGKVARFWKVGTDGRVVPDSAKDWEGVYDASTRLIWGRKLLAGEHEWKDALKVAAAATLCGAPARAPTIQERLSIVDYTRTEPALDIAFFDPTEKNAWEWTSTPASAPSGCAWLVFLGGGFSLRDNQSLRFHVRAVRAGQPIGFEF
jgi:hypothetical protein